jgi:hypothetical protein
LPHSLPDRLLVIVEPLKCGRDEAAEVDLEVLISDDGSAESAWS